MAKSFPKGTPVTTQDGQGISEGQLWINGYHVIYVKYNSKINNSVGKHYKDKTYKYYEKDVEEIEND
jgi:hypothetical protein